MKVTILIFGLVSCQALLMAQADVQYNPLTGNPQAIAAGRTLFGANCAVCHGANAQGDRGPSLVSGALAHGNSDVQIFNSIHNGIPNTAMSAYTQLSTDQVWQLIAFVRDLSGITPASPASAASEKVAGDPAAGKTVFEEKGRCLSCHHVNGAGTPVGPDLSAAASLSAAVIAAKIMNPNQPAPGAGGRGGRGGRGGPAPPATVSVTMKDNRQFAGVRKGEDSFTISMIDGGGRYHTFLKADVATLRVDPRSLMPADLSQRLSKDEIQNVVAYLKTLTAADPAKINSGTQVLSWDRLLAAEKEPQNYLTYWGDLRGTHYSPLDQINTANVKNLQAKFAIPLAGTGNIESVPLVIDGILYTIGPVVGAEEVIAADAKTGRVIWRYQRKQKVTSQYEINRSNRGVSIAGNRLFFGTLDAALIALDARNGAFLWETQVADSLQGYTITSAPLPVGDKIITGISGGEFGTNGFLDAYDQVTGKKLWRFNTVPQKGEPGADTWAGDSGKLGAAPTWLTGTYDPALDTLYWPVGNPAPEYNGDMRKGDNLYSCSVIALDPGTGKLKWYYQFTPNDTHDWDSTEDMVLVDRVWHGQNRKLILHADRNGVFYVLDRTNGKLLAGDPFVRATWLKGFDENGRPIIAPNSASDPKGNTVYPAVGGGSNFQAPSYSPQTGWMYFMYHDGPADYVSGLTPFVPGPQYVGRGTAGAGGGGAAPPAPTPVTQGVQAFDPETGKTQWKFELTQGSLSAGVMATAGGVVFAATPEGNFAALDAKTGKPLWRFTTGSGIATSPMSYSVDGKQYVVISSGGMLYSFALPD
jgi:PQQ-dependent dehydrogenase (methanol/ethanol family)